MRLADATHGLRFRTNGIRSFSFARLFVDGRVVLGFGLSTEFFIRTPALGELCCWVLSVSNKTEFLPTRMLYWKVILHTSQPTTASLARPSPPRLPASREKWFGYIMTTSYAEWGRRVAPLQTSVATLPLPRTDETSDFHYPSFTESFSSHA